MHFKLKNDNSKYKQLANSLAAQIKAIFLTETTKDQLVTLVLMEDPKLVVLSECVSIYLSQKKSIRRCKFCKVQVSGTTSCVGLSGSILKHVFFGVKLLKQLILS